MIRIPGMRCVVLGGKGFIGSHLVDALLSQGYVVRIFDRPDSVFLDEACAHHHNLEVMDGDFTRTFDVARAVEGCAVCFHLVSTTLPQSSNEDPVFDIETNLIGTVRLLDHVIAAGVAKLVFVSSGGAVYGPPVHVPISETHPTDPICSYGITKLAIEKYLQLYHILRGLDYVALRLSNLYGERQRIQSSQGAIAVFLGKALKGEKIEIWGNGSVIRDYIHISDAIAAMLAAIPYRGPERVFNIGSAQGISLNQVLGAIESVMGVKVRRTYLKGRAFDVPESVLAIERARQFLMWEPRMPFVDGLKLTVNWVERQMSRAGGSATM